MSDLCVCREYEDMFTEGYKYVESLEAHDKKVRADAIDEFMERLEELIKHGIFISRNGLFEDIEYIAEQLKEKTNV